MSLFAKDKTHALLVGVGSRNGDHPFMEITANDATKLGEVLISRCHFNPENTIDLINEEAGAENFMLELDRLAAATTLNKAEIVIIYFSGHGCVIDGEHYLICRDTINTNVKGTAISGSHQ